jgi:uncharacterized protein (TIGR00251 family)
VTALSVQSADTVLLAVRVTPKASRDECSGIGEDADGRQHLMIRVRAIPSDGAANKAVIALVAKLFGLPKSAVSLHSGGTQRIKCLALRGDLAQIQAVYAAITAKS